MAFADGSVDRYSHSCDERARSDSANESAIPSDKGFDSNTIAVWSLTSYDGRQV